MGAADKGADQGGCRCPYLRPDLLGNGPVFHYIWVVDVGHDPPHWENVGQIPPQDGLQADREETLASKGWCMVIPPNGVRNRRGGTAGGGYRCLPPSGRRRGHGRGGEASITSYGIPLSLVTSFKYISRFLLAAENDWPAVVRNLHR